MKFGEKIKLLRKQNNLTQSELASSTGVSLRTIINYEKNNKTPQKQDVLNKLASVFNVEVSYLIEDKNNDYIQSIRKKSSSSNISKPDFLADEIKRFFEDNTFSDTEKETLLRKIEKSYWVYTIKKQK